MPSLTAGQGWYRKVQLEAADGEDELRRQNCERSERDLSVPGQRELTLESFIWENTMRAAHAVASNLPPPPEERRPVKGIKPLERSKYHRRRLGTPPRRDAGCGSQWRFPRFRACARPSILGGDDLWRIDGLLTQELYRNGCIGHEQDNKTRVGASFRAFLANTSEYVAYARLECPHN